MTAQEFSTRVLEVEGMLYRVAYGILLNQSDCADAVQETLMRGWEKLHTLREEDYFRTWLTRILINQCYSIIRKRRFFLPLDSARTIAAPQDADTELHDAIARLDNKLRLPIVLHYMEGYSIDEIAQMLSQPSGTIKTRLMRARRQLRAALCDSDEFAASRSNTEAAAPKDSLSKHIDSTLSQDPFNAYNAFMFPDGTAALSKKSTLFDTILQKIYEGRKSRYE